MEKILELNIQYGEQYVDISFPCTDSELEEKLKGIGAEKTKEHFIKDILYGDRSMWMLQHRFVDLDEVNYLAKRLDSFEDYELKAFYALASVDSHLSVAELINQTFNMSRITLIEDVSNLEAVGKKHYMITHGFAVDSPDNANKATYEKIGKKLLESGEGIATQYGLMFRNEEIEEEIVYNGKTFPQYNYTGGTVIGVILEYDGNKEYVYLPCEEISIEKALKRLGAPSIDDCEREIDWLDVSNGELAKLFEDFALNDDLYDVNKLMEKFNGKNGRKIMATIKYVNNCSVDMVTAVLENLKRFEYVAGAQDFHDVGKYAIEDAVGYPLPDELDDYIDHDGYGQYIKEAYQGKFVEDGFVYLPNGEKLEEILGMAKEPKMEEM